MGKSTHNSQNKGPWHDCMSLVIIGLLDSSQKDPITALICTWWSKGPTNNTDRDRDIDRLT